jgi:two-component sensor histidine kinase
MRKIVKDLVSAAELPADKIRIMIDIPAIVLGVDTAIPLGLITNELVTNALKYAFPRDGGAELTVSLTRAEDLLTLSVKDNGAGLPEGFDYEKADTLGLQLVAVMVKQIGGTLRMRSEKGTEAIVIFREI